MAAANNGINNTVGASVSGVTNTLTVTNPSNTASSQALANITVGGGTAGDPFLTYTVSGVTNWSQGIDNSDSDAYVLAASTALGTTNVIRASTAGALNYPLQPAFRVYQNAVQTDVTGDGTDYTVVWSTAQFDQTSSFDFANERYQCPATGKYFFSCCLNLLQVGAGHTQGRAWFFNFTSNEYQFFWQGNAANEAGNANLTVSGGVMMSCTAGDLILVHLQIYNSTKTIDIDFQNASDTRNWFSGYLVC